MLTFKEEVFNLSLPEFYIKLCGYYSVIWKINVKKIISADCFVKFIVKEKVSLIDY